MKFNTGDKVITSENSALIGTILYPVASTIKGECKYFVDWGDGMAVAVPESTLERMAYLSSEAVKTCKPSAKFKAGQKVVLNPSKLLHIKYSFEEGVGVIGDVCEARLMGPEIMYRIDWEHNLDSHRAESELAVVELVAVDESHADGPQSDSRKRLKDVADQPEPIKETVNHPAHYNFNPSGVECIDVVEHMNFNVGNAMKYLWRSDHKNGIEDLRKAAWYVNREIERLSKQEG